MHYRRNYVDGGFLARTFMWSFNTLINSVNSNGGKLSEKFIEDMRVDENEDEEKVEVFKRLLQQNYERWKSKTLSDR